MRAWETAYLMRVKRMPDARTWLHPEGKRLTADEVAEHQRIAEQVADLDYFRRKREAAAARRGEVADGS